MGPIPANDDLTEVSSVKCHGGVQQVYSHTSAELKCSMNFGVYLPPQFKVDGDKLPVIYYLSGLTCTEQNVVTKGGAQQFAAKHGIIFVAPDTSPRGCNIEGEEDSYDFGSGAGFYLDATEEKWKTNYRMYSYVTKELRNLVDKYFNTSGKQSITGHSMGGHGAQICALKNPGLYSSVSSFSPICNPVECAWGQKAFTGYLGADKETWKAYDSCELLKNYKGPALNLLADQGAADGFLKDGQLLTDHLEKACAVSGQQATVRMQEGYDHSYYFINTFMGDHIDHHAKYLK